MWAFAERPGISAAYVLLVTTAFTGVYDPLGDLPILLSVVLLAAPQVGLGLAVARPWAPALPITAAAPWAIGGDAHNAFSYRLGALGVLALALVAALLVLAGVLAGPFARNATISTRIGAVLVALSFVPLGWAVARWASPLDAEPAQAQSIDARAGTVDGIGLGAAPAEVIMAFGAGTPSPTAPISPVGDDFARISAPPLIETPGETHAVLRYPSISFLLSDGAVYGVIVTADDAETKDGVGVGDNLDTARDAYPELRCGKSEAEHRRTFPYCAGRLADGRWAWFGDDPIRSIALASTRL
ncbi:MAG: hypothetical protein ABR583_08935 [Gaiellaceae bacterium]